MGGWGGGGDVLIEAILKIFSTLEISCHIPL